MADLADFEAMVPGEHGLAVMTVIGPDGRMRPSVVNVGVLDHPLTGVRVVGAVIQGRARKLANLRERPRISVVLRAAGGGRPSRARLRSSGLTTRPRASGPSGSGCCSARSSSRPAVRTTISRSTTG